MRKRFTWAALIFLSIGTMILNLSSDRAPQSKNQGKDALLGTWFLQKSQSATAFSVQQLEFLDSDTFLANTSLDGQETYNIRFNYRYVGEGKIIVSAPRRLTSEWTVTSEDGELLISGSPWPTGVGIFKRGTTINWPSIAVLFAFWELSAFLIAIPGARSKDRSIQVASDNSHLSTGLARYIIFNILALIAFIGGIAVGLLVWSSPLLLSVRPPWDAVITVELSVFLFVFGVRIIVANHVAFMCALATRVYVLGVFLIGTGLSGLVVGGASLLMLLQFGYYP